VILPVLAAWMEKFGDLIRLRINARQIGAFVEITIDASQRQIVEIIAAAMAFRNNVFDMEGSQRGVHLMEAAVFAAITGALTNPGSGSLIHRLGCRAGQSTSLPLEDGDELIGPHITRVLSLFRFGELAF
jgi:hypothetical protein